MPTLEWIGKDKVINHHQEVPFRGLEKQYFYGAEDSESIVTMRFKSDNEKPRVVKVDSYIFHFRFRKGIKENL